MTSLLLFLLLLSSINDHFECKMADLSYIPKGNNPTLYKSTDDAIVLLDEITFADTIFGQNERAYFVEFYADWCGHCRAFAPYYRDFARSVAGWSEVVVVAAINCADTFNKKTCLQNHVTFFPLLKYFPRDHSSAALSIDTPAFSSTDLRDQLGNLVVNEYNQFHHPDWPYFVYIDKVTTYGDLWRGSADSADYLAIIFEQYDSVGAKFLLDMHNQRHIIAARRALSTNALSTMLRINVYPMVVVFRRNHQQAIYTQRYDVRTTIVDMHNIIQSHLLNNRMHLHAAPINEQSTKSSTTAMTTTTRPIMVTARNNTIIACDQYPDRCKQLYYVSETDMLKAMHQALFNEVSRQHDEYIRDDNFTALYNFVHLLANHFPVLTFANQMSRTGRIVRSPTSILKNSERAKEVFAHLSGYLESKKEYKSITVREWELLFTNLERIYAYPFPVNATWQHCHGSTIAHRGYTCGLWTAFHALTVHAYLDTIKDDKFDVLYTLRSIQGWVDKFFGCRHCRDHFMNMTTVTYPMDRRVRHNHDSILYLWRAHNIVNARLKGDTATEDPQFIKYQFPPLFLCRTCAGGGAFSRREVRNFLIRYYGNIRPHDRVARRSPFVTSSAAQNSRRSPPPPINRQN